MTAAERTIVVLSATAALVAVLVAAGRAAACPGAGASADQVTLAQAGGSGVNVPDGAVAPKTDVAPGGTTGSEDDVDAPRTSRSFGSGNPLAGDEIDDLRPDSDPRSGENAIDADEPRGPRGVD